MGYCAEQENKYATATPTKEESQSSAEDKKIDPVNV